MVGHVSSTAAAVALLLVTPLLSSVQAHSRWKCPPARSDETGLKTGPCGGASSTTPMVIAPGPFTVQFEESISHTGAPWRFSLLNSDDTLGCVLLDHIPHNNEGPASFTDLKQYTITIQIPDVACENCALQLVNPMTDKISRQDLLYCTDPDGTCFSVYHSCADITITGTKDLNQENCGPIPDDTMGWPFVYDRQRPGVYYPSESITWTDTWIDYSAMDAKYTTPAGECVGVANPTVSPTDAPGGTGTNAPTDAPKDDGKDFAEAHLSTYPGGEDAGVTGTIRVEATSASLKMSGVLKGLPTDTAGGIHIHVGESCDSNSEVGGHWYDGAVDPWVGETTYASDASGSAVLAITMTAAKLGYDPLLSLTHAVVVHNAEGTRIACGLLGGKRKGPSDISSASPFASSATIMFLFSACLLVSLCF